MATSTCPPKLEEFLKLDSHLHFFQSDIIDRYTNFKKLVDHLEEHEGGLTDFTASFKKYGLVVEEKGILCREWIPDVENVWLYGDFNDWNKHSHQFAKKDFGKWEIFLPQNADGTLPIKHGSKYKLLIQVKGGEIVERISPWAGYVVQNATTKLMEPVFWHPDPPYKMTHPRPEKPRSLRIYECHVGIASEDYCVASYTNFKDNVLPYIKDTGYNAIQIMAVMEHAYYASFGYQVTSYFAPSSRYGTPDELKALVDEAHRLGITVLLDIVHSHASKNVLDGLNQFNGSNACYFHDNGRGFHSLWDSRLFNYTSWEVLRFLLSNLRWYIEEFGFDGFRFDGVTSMLYHHHGLGTGFSGGYHEYFSMGTDVESFNYLQLANHMLHSLYPFAITIAEDVSGMPGLCRPVEEGGCGFDYRLGMALPDMWIKMLKEQSDEDWNIGDIAHTMENRRFQEKTICYAESHDQALVGDKTLAFWLMDKEMYTQMSTHHPLSSIIDRGIALHKMIRLLTCALGGESYLTFIGNEFGHPEWLDFPRAGNNDSYHYARRQWGLVKDDSLRFKFLRNFEKGMFEIEEKSGFLSAHPAYVSCKHEDDKVVVFERAHLIFVFNFHCNKSFSDYHIGTDLSGKYKVLLDSDEEQYGGHKRIDHSARYFSHDQPYHGRSNTFKIYIPCRTALVFGICED